MEDQFITPDEENKLGNINCFLAVFFQVCSGLCSRILGSTGVVQERVGCWWLE